MAERNHGSARKSPVWRMAPLEPSIRNLTVHDAIQNPDNLNGWQGIHNGTWAMVCIK
jgi:hypothetical protein